MGIAFFLRESGATVSKELLDVTFPNRNVALIVFKDKRVRLPKEKEISDSYTYLKVPDFCKEVLTKVQAEGIPFEDFYSLYPKKVSKKEAEKLWKKLPRETQEEILEVLPNWASYMLRERESKAQIMNPARFLRGEHWNDASEYCKAEGPSTADEVDTRKRLTFKELANR